MSLNKDAIVLITGGAGFIGSNLVRKLNSVGISNIIIIDNFHNCRDNKWKNLIGLNYIHLHDINTDGTKSDLYKNRLLDDIMDDVEVVIHLGALNNTSEHDFGKFFNLNIQFSRNILCSAIQSKSCNKFIYASSASTYGNRELFDDTQPIESLIPTNAYGMSKQIVDQNIFSTILGKSNLIKDKKFDVVGLKFSNVFGVGEQHKIGYSSFPHKVLTTLYKPTMLGLTGGKIPIDIFKEKDVLMSRDFVYIDDVIDRMMLLIDGDIKQNTIYNIGSGYSIEWDNLYTKLHNEFIKQYTIPANVSVFINHIPIPREIKAGYQYHTEMNMSKFDNDYPEFKATHSFVNADDYYDSRIKSFVEKFIG